VSSGEENLYHFASRQLVRSTGQQKIPSGFATTTFLHKICTVMGTLTLSTMENWAILDQHSRLPGKKTEKPD
jgi:hypothetical protein